MLERDGIAQLWDRIRSSLWFVPGLLTLLAIGLAYLTPMADRLLPAKALREFPLIYAGSADGARSVLTTIATAMISTAGVVFSMTLITLQLASSQFGPRLLRSFLRDRGNQVVLGTYIGIFVYCILVLPTIASEQGTESAPHVAVTVALVLAVLGLGMLVYYIDHVAQSIHADAVIRAVATELDDVIDKLFPETLGAADRGGARASEATIPDKPGARVTAEASGYLRYVNGDALVEVASAEDLVLQLERSPGDFVFVGDTLLTVYADRALEDDCAARLRKAFALGAHRSALQDAPFAFEQLAEMAVRALSPGINDPTTAVHCVDRIGSGLCALVERELPPRARHDADGELRILAEPVALEEILRRAALAIARNIGVHVPVWQHLLTALGKAAARSRRAEDQEALRACAREVSERARDALPHARDRELVLECASWLDEG